MFLQKNFTPFIAFCIICFATFSTIAQSEQTLRQASSFAKTTADAQDRPNVLLISLDDLNDWIEPMGGHPQAKTPNLAALAEQSVTFGRAYCASPGCNPSRTALMTGKAPHVTGLYTNPQIWRHILPNEITLPEYFQAAGYWTGGAGKIYHNNMPDPRSWNDYYPSLIQHFPYYYLPDTDPKTGKTILRKQDNEIREDDPKGLSINMPDFKGRYVAIDWAPLPFPTEETGDYESANWIIEQLGKKHDKPFFLACGLYRPHMPWYVPKKYFGRFPLDEVQLPDSIIEDLDDIPAAGKRMAGRKYHHNITQAGQWQAAVQGYLAAINYADDLTGMVLDALANSEYADNTIVVVYSDHGWQLGEKQHWRKFALWENVIKSVLMVKAPKDLLGESAERARGSVSNRNVSLMDIFPTLTELCGLPDKEGLNGRSLIPLLKNPNADDGSRPIVTMHTWEHFSIRKDDWHYIAYGDGSAELYNLAKDPEEWKNLANDPQYAPEIEALRQHIPKQRKEFTKTDPIRWADVLSGKTKMYLRD
jgi:arylsulfatase A-like enzyme|tara:strand:+ start:2173 stop:3771 length:1599 start_codon:yes stop_codon:yes gene_type:complete